MHVHGSLKSVLKYCSSSTSGVSVATFAWRLPERGFPDQRELRRVHVPIGADAEVVSHVLVPEEETCVTVAAGCKFASLGKGHQLDGILIAKKSL